MSSTRDIHVGYERCVLLHIPIGAVVRRGLFTLNKSNTLELSYVYLTEQQQVHTEHSWSARTNVYYRLNSTTGKGTIQCTHTMSVNLLF